MSLTFPSFNIKFHCLKGIIVLAVSNRLYRERERERECVCVCVRERECVCVRERDRGVFGAFVWLVNSHRNELALHKASRQRERETSSSGSWYLAR